MKRAWILFACVITTVCASKAAPIIIEDSAQVPLLTPSLAQRQILKIRLKNGLEALLISDPEAKKAAAALCVEAGSWEDPKEYPGMAHFLEHMLFMGTKAYPQEGEYQKYIWDQGGQLNAATWPDHTSYMFSINNDAFAGALDRFAHFFIDPLFSTSSIAREMHAVDQEHAKNIEHDGYRAYMVFKETSNPNHPHHTFCTGNAQTLSSIPQEALKKWFAEHYGANRMHLILLSSLPLETLEELTVNSFSAIAQTSYVPSPYKPMTTAAQKGHKIYISPIQDIKNISILWELPQEYASIQDQDALRLISYILSSKCKNTLYDHLKNMHFIEDITAHTERYSKDSLLFTIDIDLTDEGTGHIDAIIGLCFQALAELQAHGIPPALYEELRLLTQMHYQYQAAEDPFQFVMHTADAMPYEPLTTFPERTSLLSPLNPTHTTTLLDKLTPTSAIYMISLNPSYLGRSFDRQEKWMGVDYMIEAITTDQLTAWEESKSNTQLALPHTNPFVPKDFSLVTSPSTTHAQPQLIAKDPEGTFYFTQDNKYLVPKTAAFVSLSSEHIVPTIQSIVQAELYIKTLQEELAETLFLAQTAGLHTTISLNDLKLNLFVNGYSSSVPSMLKALTTACVHTVPTKEKFQLYRQSLLTQYENESCALPFFQSYGELLNLMFNDKPTGFEKEKVLRMLSYEEFVDFCLKFHTNLYIESSLYGNTTEKQAKEIWENIKTTLQPTSYFSKDNKTLAKIRSLPEAKGPYLISQHTQRQGHAAFLLIQQGQETFKTWACQRILGSVLQEAFYDTLRTKQQTSYIARAWPMETKGQLLQFFAVQSSSHHPMELLARFELFIEDFLQNFEDKLPSERFETIRSMLITSLQIPPQNLEDAGARTHLFAYTYDSDFTRIEKQIEGVSSVTYTELKSYAKEVFSRANTKRLALLMEGAHMDVSRPPYEHISKQDLSEYAEYAR